VPSPSRPPAQPGVAFLLAQLGAHAAQRYAAALTDLDITPPLAGIMRLLRVQPGLSQQQIADRLGSPPSRVVGYLDDLESRGWISRSRDTDDRRVNVVTLTAAGQSAFTELARVSRDHERRITASLSDDERARLKALLEKLAGEQGLSPGVHPGYRDS
jgi:DNA-binding MarR family transcriptional regulator